MKYDKSDSVWAAATAGMSKRERNALRDKLNADPEAAAAFEAEHATAIAEADAIELVDAEAIERLADEGGIAVSEDIGETEPETEEEPEEEKTPESSGVLDNGGVEPQIPAYSASTILSPSQSRVAEKVRETVRAALSQAVEATKGTTAAIFQVMRLADNPGDAEIVLFRLESDWMAENNGAPIPGSWRTIKSRLFKPYKELQGLISKAAAGAEKHALSQSFDAETRAKQLATLRLDGDKVGERMQPVAFQPDQAGPWLASVGNLRKAVTAGKTAEERAARGQSGATGSGLQSGNGGYSVEGIPDEVKSAIARCAGACRAAVGKVPQQEIVNLLENVTTTIAARVKQHDATLNLMKLGAKEEPEAAKVAA